MWAARPLTDQTGSAMATPGTYVSVVGHTALVVWLLAGWGLSSDPFEIEPITFTSISGEDFDQLTQRTTPNPGDADPTAPVVPEVETAPEAPAAEQAPTPVEPPAPTETPVAELPPPAAPEPPAPLPPEPETPPAVQPPAPDPTPAIDEPISDRPPQQRPADRIASEPIVAPEPDVAIDAVPEVATEPAETPAETPPVEPVEEVAQPETATEIVTEADEPSGAVETSLRPTARPSRPAPEPEPVEPETATAEPADTGASIDDVLAGVVGDSAAQPDIPQGPPMTGSEREGFRVAVNGCWNVDPGSVAATVTVVVGFSLTQDGKVEGNDVRFVSSQGPAAAVDVAFAAARRAILRCQGSGGYDLPAEKYGQWKDVEITFDPSGMRLR